MAEIGAALAKIAEVLDRLQSSSNKVPRIDDSRGIQLHPYDESNETFENYLQRVENYLELRDLKPDSQKSVSILLNCVGPKIHQILTSLTAPDLPKDKTYKELTQLLRNHFCPKPSVIAEQHKFSMRVQHEGETITSFLAELKRLAANCNFNCEHCKKSTLATHLRSQMIRGLRDTDIRERLLQLDVSTKFEDVVRSALSIEASKLESKEMRGEPSIHTVNKVKYPKRKNTHTNVQKQKSVHDNSQSMSAKSTTTTIRCYRCGKVNHKANVCNKKNLKCFKCNKMGHVKSVCMSNTNRFQEHNVIDRETDSSNNEVYYINNMMSDSTGNGKMIVNVLINGKECKMEFDTGAAVSTLSEQTFLRLFPQSYCKNTTVRLKTYTGELIYPVGVCNVNIRYRNLSVNNDLYIIRQSVSSIMGRDLIRKLGLDAKLLHQLQPSMTEVECRERIEQLIQSYSDLFSEKVGTIPNYECSFKLQDEATTPIFLRPRPVPYSLKKKIEEELNRLESNGIIEKTDHAPWGTPIVPIIKKDGSLRLCADYKATINRVICDDNYPIPRVEDIFAKMSGGKYFCALDLYQAYLHMNVNEHSAQMQAISTHVGNYKVKRLMFGVKVAPNTWQRFMDSIIYDLQGVSCFFDDIIIQGSTYIELLQNLTSVFNRLRKFNLHVNKKKCQFLQKSITYLGHVIDADGIHPMPEKIKAIVESKRPRNVSELRTFLGLLNYYQKFIPDLASKLRPLNKLLAKDTRFIWTTECENIFKTLKKEITDTKTLIPYTPELPLILATDASPTGLGAVLSHVTEDGSEQPIAFASRTLTKTERNYSQIDREATAIVWGLRKFFQYVYGRKFTLITDHKPLVSILHPNKDLPATSAIRLLHYANFMSGFNYQIQYRSTKNHCNADYLSRFPLTTTSEDAYDDDSIFQLQQVNTLPVTNEEIKKETARDMECRAYYIALRNGEPLPFGEPHSDFALLDGCVFRGIRVMIPKILRQRILDELHVAHTGIVKMKALARSYVWWRGIDKDIEAVARQCSECALVKANPSKVPVHAWEYSQQPWQRIHIDYAGPFMEYNFLIVVDSYTKWIEAIPTKRITTEKTIRILREIFARFGLPLTLVSDNGPQFCSAEFKEFLRSNGIIHKLCAPYHPATNGQAERYVQTVKQGLRTMTRRKGDLHSKLCGLLMQLRKVPSSTTGRSPADLMLHRTLRTRIDLVTRKPMDSLIAKQKPLLSKVREFQVGDRIQVRFYNNPNCIWKFGKIHAKMGKLHYTVVVDGKLHFRHIDQLRSTDCNTVNVRVPIYYDELKRSDESQNKPSSDDSVTIDMTKPPDLTDHLISDRLPSLPAEPASTNSSKCEKDVGLSSDDKLPPPTSPTAVTSKPANPDARNEAQPVPVRRSTRTRRAPERLQY